MKKLLLLLIPLFLLTSCRDNDPIVDSEVPQKPDVPTNPSNKLKGFYVLNEGNMAQNKASIDYYDYATNSYERNIFSKANPDLVGGLGDVGNDMGVYGSKLYVVVNGSNKVEVLDVDTGKRLKEIKINSGRHITFYKGKAYLSTYLGKIGDPNAPKGLLAEIDTTSLSITRTVEVGRQPEELVAYNDKIYVANSGGYSPPDYETTISVVDVADFTETNRIEVGVNLHRLKLDDEGDLYVTSRGDYFDIPSRLFVVDTKTETIKKTFDLAVSDMTIHKGIVYMYSTEFSYKTGKNTITYSMLDTKTETLLDGSFISEAGKKLIEIPYGIAVDPENDDIIVTDAKDYVTPGNLYCFSPNGELKWKLQTGDIPSQVTFIYK